MGAQQLQQGHAGCWGVQPGAATQLETSTLSTDYKKNILVIDS